MAVKTRWDQKTYRRHMFNRGRGVRSPHDTSNTKLGTSQFVDSQLGQGHWWEASWRSPWATRLDAAKEYEQYNNPDSAGWSPFTLDSTERERFRRQDRKEVRDLFQKQLSEHHFSKHKKLSSGQLDKIVDAYMSQDDDKFQATLAGMGFSDKDAGRVRRAAEESATAAIEGNAYGTKWDDDDYAKQPGAKPGAAVAGNQPGQAGQGGTVTNGQLKVGQPGAAQGQVLTPRQPGAKVARHSATAASTRRPYQRPGASYNDLDGAHVRQGSPAEIHTEQSLAARAQTMALQDQQEAQNQVARSAHSQYGAYQEGQNERERIEQMGKDRRARQAAEREAAARQRADKRYESRTLYNEDDWKNLGREGSNRANYAAEQQAGETEDQYKARQKSIADRDARLAALVKRMDDMGVQDAEKNSFYANDPNKQQNLARLRGLVDKAGKSITDAQMEGVTATLDAWQKGADEKGARQKAFTDMKQAEEVSRLRNMYGMQLSDGFNAEDVLKFHRTQQANARRKILEGMQVAPGLTPMQEEGGGAAKGLHDPEVPVRDLRPAAMAKFSQDWQKLIDNGFDPHKAFQDAMSDDVTKASYIKALGTLDRNDPDYADKQDQLRRRFIMNQAMDDAGLGVQKRGAEQFLPGRQLTQLVPTQEKPGALAGNATDEQRTQYQVQLKQYNEGVEEASDANAVTMTAGLPGRAALVQNRQQSDALRAALTPKRPQQSSGVQVFTNPADALRARNELNAEAGLRPRQPQARLRPGDKREETLAW